MWCCRSHPTRYVVYIWAGTHLVVILYGRNNDAADLARAQSIRESLFRPYNKTTRCQYEYVSRCPILVAPARSYRNSLQKKNELIQRTGTTPARSRTRTYMARTAVQNGTVLYVLVLVKYSTYMSTSSPPAAFAYIFRLFRGTQNHMAIQAPLNCTNTMLLLGLQ